MGLKKWLQRLRPATLYLVLALSLIHFLAQIITCHISHSLTLLMDGCHMLCNIIALVGCIITLKYESKPPNPKTQCQIPANKETKPNSDVAVVETKNKRDEKEIELVKINEEKRLKNTFGWARIEVLMLLVVSIFFISLSYSVTVEALQTLFHIDHKQSIECPEIIVIMGIVGLCLNVFCYLLIGGFTYHQGSFIHLNNSGEVVLDSTASVDSVRQGERRLSHLRRTNIPKQQVKRRESFREIIRDLTSCIFVIISGAIVYFVDDDIGIYVDPSLTILSAAVLLCLTIPYIKESALILLQTMPETMDIEALHAILVKSFPDIVNIHDFHVWQLTTSKIILTMHIIFLNPMDYSKHSENVIKFLLEKGVTEVTIQPEFQSSNEALQCTPDNYCLMKCKTKGCDSKHCCNQNNMLIAELESVKCNKDEPEKKSPNGQCENIK